MAYKFNALTGKLDLVGESSGSTITKKEVIKAILVETDYTVDFPKADIIFDEDSILYNDDEELQ